MNNATTLLLMIATIILISSSCGHKKDAEPLCPFQIIQFVEENQRNEASLKLSTELNLILKLSTKMPIELDNFLHLNGEIKEVTDKYVQKPIDIYLAGTLNTYLQGTICNTFIMSQKAETPQEKSFYDSLLQQQFVLLTKFMDTYSNGKDPKPLPDCPSPPKREKVDESQIEHFFTERINSAKSEDTRRFWEERRLLVKTYIDDCRKSEHPAKCMEALFEELKVTYDSK